MSASRSAAAARAGRRGMLGPALTIAALHAVGWSVLLAVVAPQHLSAGTRSFGVGVGVTAYLLGMRHAFDADHIAAIDNATRKLTHAGRHCLSIGFWFSLGHSSVVFALTLLLAMGIKALAGPVLDEHSGLHQAAAWIGTLVSGGFLYLIALLNLAAVADSWRAIRGRRHAEAAAPVSGGPLARLWKPALGWVGRPRQMYLLGLLFGLGFDTASEIALLVLSGSGAASGLPWYAVLCLPVLFAAGMSLFDTLDGSFMGLAYGWALEKPARRAYYNLAVTLLSVAVALLIGTLEFAGLLAGQARLRGPLWDALAAVDLNRLGLVVVGLFAAAWVIALLAWRRGGEGGRAFARHGS